MQIETWLRQDIQGIVKVHNLFGQMFSLDSRGNLIGVRCYNGGEEAELTGTVTGNVIRADGRTVTVSGSLEGNRAWIILPDSAYAIPGPLTIVIKLLYENDVTTLAAAVANVYQSETDSAVDPGTIIPSIRYLIDQINAAIASIPADYSSLWASVAPAYDQYKTYEQGAYRTYDGGLYRCISPITTAEEWTAEHWESVSIGPEINELKTLVTEVENEHSNMLSAVQDVFTVQTEINGFWSVGTRKLNNNNGDSVHHTRLVPTKGFNRISGRTYMDSSGYAVAYFNDQFELMTDISIVGTGNVRFFESEGQAIVLPAEAKYVSISGWGTATDYPIDFISDAESTLSGRIDTVEENIKTNLSVSYADFGAVMDGETDDTEAVIACHAFANAHGVPVVQHSGTILMKTADNSNCAQIKTDCDWTGATFLITPDINNAKICFAVAADDNYYETNPVTLQEYQKAQLVKGILNIDFLRGYYDNELLSFETDISIGTRNETGVTGATNYTETITTDRNGGLMDGALFKDMTGAGTVTMIRRSILDKPITIKGGKFLLQTTVWMSNPYYLYISRANVTLEGLLIDAGARRTNNDTTYRGEFIRADHAYNLTIRDCVAENFSTFFTYDERYSRNVAYILCVTNSSKIMLDHCVFLRGWGSIQTSFCKHLTAQDCTIGRVDNHYGCRDYLIDRCTLVTSHSNINIGFGDGYLIVRDSKFIKTRDYDTFLQSRLISCREDFCALFSGTIVVDNVFVESEYDVTLIAAAYESTFDYLVNGGTILPCSLPKIEVRGVHVTMLGDSGAFTLLDYGVKAGASVLTYQTAVDMPVAVVDGVQSNQAGIIGLSMESVAVVGGKYAVRVKHSNVPYTISDNADRVRIGDWKAPVIVNSASGAIASFADGADDMPVKGLTVEVEPVQDLHGYDKPWPAGGGKNKSGPMEIGTISESKSAGTEYSNMKLASTTRARSSSLIPTNGQSYTVSWDTANYRVAVGLFDENQHYLGMQNGWRGWSTAIFTGGSSSVHFVAIAIKRSDEGAITDADIANFKLQLEIGDSATSYAPYSNICPITGWTGAKVTRTGVNIWDEEWEVGAINEVTGQIVNSVNRIRSKNYIPCSPNTQYNFSFPSSASLSTGNIRVMYYDRNKAYLSFKNWIATGPFTTPNDAKYMKFYTNGQYGETYNHDISINYPASDTSYHPYSGETYDITFPSSAGTVYGGTLDVTTGVLTVDRAMYTFVGDEAEGWGGYSSSADTNDFRYRTEKLTDRLTKSGTNGRQKANWLASTTGDVSSGNSAIIKSIRQSITFMTVTSLRLYVYVPDIMTSAYDLTEWRAYLAAHPLTVCYLIAEPYTVQLDPVSIQTLLGTNNIWADTGDSAVSYPADTKLYIERRIAEAVANALNA